MRFRSSFRRATVNEQQGSIANTVTETIIDQWTPEVFQSGVILRCTSGFVMTS